MLTTQVHPGHPAGVTAAAPRARNAWLRRAASMLALWLLRAHTRQALAELDEHLLHDIGVTPRLARHESAKFFWQP